MAQQAQQLQKDGRSMLHDPGDTRVIMLGGSRVSARLIRETKRNIYDLRCTK